MEGRFKIIVPSFNSVRYLPKTLSSIESQLYRGFDVCVIDDCSSFKEQREIILDYCQRNGWNYLFHDKNLGTLASIIDGINLLECQDEDIIVLIDGDDWLYDQYVLDRVIRIYREKDVYLTYGQYQTYPSGCVKMYYATGIPDEVIDQQLYRQIIDVFLPLRTFKTHLYRRIKDQDLRDPTTGEYFMVCSDKALMYPMLEMAGYKIHFISDVLYIYNIDNPINDFKINREEQVITTDYLRSKKPYKRLPNTGKNLEKNPEARIQNPE